MEFDTAFPRNYPVPVAGEVGRAQCRDSGPLLFEQRGDVRVPLQERVLSAEVLGTLVTAFTLVLTALFSERDKVENSLRHSEGLLAKKSVALTRLHDASSQLWHKRNLREGLDQAVANGK